MKCSSKTGLTLIEIMVSVALLAVFGLMIVSVLSQSMQVWKITEQRREILEVSRNTMEILSEDLNALYIPDNANGEIGLLLDYDTLGRQRLRFLRKITQENTHPVLRYAGTESPEKGKKLEHYDLQVNANEKFLAPGGIAEVVYCFVPQGDNVGLWRGIRTPAGGEGSFFVDKNIDSSQKIQAKCHLLAEKIIYWEIKCWAQNTFTWKSSELPKKNLFIKGGPSLLWDSSGKKLSTFFLFNSLNKTSIKPLKLNVNLVFQDGKPKELAANVAKEDTTLYLNNTQGLKNNQWHYILVDKEWMSYEDTDGNALLNLRRGMLNSKVENHTVYKEVITTYYEKWDVNKASPKTLTAQQIVKVYAGIPFIKTISLP